MKPTPLRKKIINKMTETELARYEKLQREWMKTGEEMVKAHAVSAEYSRKLDKMKNPTAAQKRKDQKLINAGFRAEYIAFKKADEYVAFKKKMEGKY